LQKWQKRRDWCVHPEGDYFEGDGTEWDTGKT
jgi:hypothetical protein